MIQMIGNYKYKDIIVFKMFDAGAVWYEVDYHEEILFFDTIKQAQNFIDEVSA